MQRLTGTVIEGKKQARGLGYPTANLAYVTDVTPEAGVWTCRATLDGKRFGALAVVGMWKLDSGLPSLEVHLLDVSDNLYDRTLSVELIERLRDLIPFTDVVALKRQIEKDIAQAKEKFHV